MAIQHLVLLDLDAGLAEAEGAELFRKMAGLLKQVPGVLDVKGGRNFTSRAPNVTHGLIVTMKDREALAGYGPHPKHVEAQGMLKPYVKNISVVDFEA